MSLLLDHHFTSISDQCETVTILAKLTTNFKSQIDRLTNTLQSVQNLDHKWTRDGGITVSWEDSSEIIALIQEADKLVRKCPEMKWNYFKKFNHARKLDQVNDKLLKICRTQLVQTLEIEAVQNTTEIEPAQTTETETAQTRETPESRSISGSAPTTATAQWTPIERPTRGWQVTRLPRGIITFDEPLKKLKARVLSAGIDMDDDDEDGSVLVVSAAGGCGKTSLVNILCNDHEIQAKYGDNVFYVTVPEKPNFMEIVNDLLNPNRVSQQAMIRSNKDARDKLEKFLREQVLRGAILLVLDDVQSDLFIKNFQFKIRGYKIVVTSKMIFSKYDVFQLEPLSDEDATALFKLSAFDKISIPTIDEDLVNQMIKFCKKHPLTLSVVGNSLYGKPEFVWKSLMKTLSQGEWCLDKKDVTKHLRKTIEQLDEEFNKHNLAFEELDEEFKQCLMDFGLFQNDQKISACALLDIWMSLYDYDDMGRDTFLKIFQLADRDLISSITIGKEANAIVNYCEQTFAAQHDWQRALAVHSSSKEPISRRTRLIINAQGNDLPASIRQMKGAMNARILSISTGESFSSRWCNMNVPEVEVMVLNIMSETYTLPHFLENMHRLKVLNVSNYGLHPTKFVNVHLFGSLTSLTRIRLERVVLTLLSTSILALVNLEKLSLIMCKIGNSFEKLSTDNLNVWPRMVEIEVDTCQDLVRFPELFCNIVHLEKLSVTNCNEMTKIPEEFSKLSSLETLSLRSCIKLENLPDSISGLKKLSILDISDCLSLSKLPENIGELAGLKMVYMKGCTGIQELPTSVKDLSQTQVLCNEELSYKWLEFPNVNIPVVEEDRLFTLCEQFSYACFY